MKQALNPEALFSRHKNHLNGNTPFVTIANHLLSAATFTVPKRQYEIAVFYDLYVTF
ncbi:MAG: hypothetical protein FWB80_10855 [Defluviitaleaceae bacterium]|nr:hypothetical protein [Defluviitaleaceae bacterium]